MSDPLLFEDSFTVTGVNAQKYDRVSRLTCTSSDASITFTLDVNSELYPCAVGESLSMALASTLSLDGKEDTRASWREVSMGEQTLANDYDYVCHGKVYRFEEGSTKDTMAVFVSFGGLLLYLEGPYKKLAPLKIDHVYLLLKK
ncbi:RNA polymerase Rpb8 [Penicillium odoratum]|uniref:RNA polymerase Rpb8 n=1 Tax=Penicillium longicatenatum TaxID=1561947 RepID=UPI00254669D9|nr:RNA polymerase Rpb8 [Penicillium longicatenatum]XP_056991031.1 RNA polymerase Rpb8 [Penicillium odoratum]KAJ5654116.1 RNA polymeraseRpb8 [Penicillium lividum]KAJ6102479.1 RNA polymerase [Penicillium sp. IBT 16267x]KAJ5636267.1 RNA polymerase Rpb8 [Penicillium longicatenatum]KAJ5656464.1 RNA polymerase Rpb8 [Penicillium longicatenatum]KAJ5746162.1 RNA polymerase Rpb8 [Penicillium odoratum]